MANIIEMPKLSDTMTVGTLVKWLKKEGDAVKAGDILAEIETDKATMEFESIDEGRIGKILIPEGTEGVKVIPLHETCPTLLLHADGTALRLPGPQSARVGDAILVGTTVVALRDE